MLIKTDREMDTLIKKLPKWIPRSIEQDKFKITFGQRFLHFYQGRIILFFKMGKKFDNEIADDGFIADGSSKEVLAPENNRLPFIASVFVKAESGIKHWYLGDVSSIVLHHDKDKNSNDRVRNKFLWG